MRDYNDIMFLSLEGFGDWSSRGCRVAMETEEMVACECDHLTNFAILMVSCWSNFNVYIECYSITILYPVELDISTKFPHQTLQGKGVGEYNTYIHTYSTTTCIIL